MSRMVNRGRIAPVVAVLLGLVVLGMFALTVVFDALVHTLGTGGPVVESLSIGAAAIPATCVGVLLAARRPRNPIGWLLFAILIVGGSPTAEYDILDYRMHHGTLPLGGLSVVIQECWPLFLAFVAILLWVFPDGKLPAGRWRRPSVILLVVGLVIAVTASLSGVVAVAGHSVHITAEGDLANPPKGFFLPFYAAAIVLSLAAWLAWIVIQIPTYRHADGERRQQLKWLYSGAVVTLVAFVFGVFVIPVAMGQGPGYGNNAVVTALIILAFGAMPASLAVAVLKYRLYELDRIISRVRLLHPDHSLAGGFLHRPGAADHARAAVQVGGGRGGLHADHRRPVQPAAEAGAARGGPAVQPVPVQRRGRGGRVHRPDAADRRLQRRPRRPGRRGARGVPAHPGVHVAR